MDRKKLDGEIDMSVDVERLRQLHKSARERVEVPKDVLEFEVPNLPEMLRDVRLRVAEFAAKMPFTSDDIDDITLAVGEAGANAVRHGANPGSCRLGVRAERHNDSVRIFIIDKGCGFDPNSITAPSVSRFTETGRGIMFMRLVMDEVNFHTGPLGTRVELVKRFRHLS
ncbi:MAG: ATP-binding protein [Armatimonadetes bacterium]|nr:ATP-binding protein [Armatimonadota bacterium]